MMTLNDVANDYTDMSCSSPKPPAQVAAAAGTILQEVDHCNAVVMAGPLRKAVSERGGTQ